MNNISKFKIGMLFVFGFFILIAVIVFASTRSDNQTIKANLVMWGTVNSNLVNQYLSSFTFDAKRDLTVTYFQKKQETFNSDLAEAIADGKGPDILFLPSDMIMRQKNRILTIPYKNYPERNFKDSFAEVSEIFLTKEGIISVPIIVDPLVMYWNRDILRNKLKTTPPEYWDEFQTLTPDFVEKDNLGNIKNTFSSFGEWRNVSNAKEILSNLFIQSGNDIVVKNDFGLSSDLLDNKNNVITPAISAVTFYTQFANPTLKTYSWNRSLPKSQDFFLSGNMAIYFGPASELSQIRAKNPNLNFDVAIVPQIKSENKVNKVYAKVYGLSIVKSSQFIPQAFQAINTMTTKENIALLENISNLPPIRKDLLSTIPSDLYKSVFYKSAIWSKSFMDVDGTETNLIFQNMIESITSGRKTIYDSISTANDALNDLLVKYEK